MRRAIVGLALIAGCVDKPGGFGVNVEVLSSALDDATRGQLAGLGLHVRGAESFDKASLGDVGALLQKGTVRFHYVPGVHAGSLTFELDGLDGAAMIVASGAAPPVGLVDGKAVDVTVTLAPGAHNGQPGVDCTSNDQCLTGNCIDGVCCDTACDGTCEACNLDGTKGTCSPIPAGTDPNMECQAKLSTSNDGGASDGGTSVMPLDGGVIMIAPQQCAGTCSGNRSCSYPSASQSCGQPFCSAQAEAVAFVCDGTGGCNQAINDCPNYACGAAGACLTSCNGNGDCGPTSFCNLNLQQCVPKRSIGTACTPGNNFECASGFCANGFCCNSDCTGANMSCNNPGKEGQCQCTGVTCDPGVGCVVWYRDGDGDTYGDSGGTIGNGNAKIGCDSGTNAPPAANFVKNSGDCDDADNRAHPGGTFQTTARTGKGGFDFNCDNTEEHSPLYPGSCGACGYVTLAGGQIACENAAACTGTNATYLACGFTGGGLHPCPCCGQATSGYIADSTCGNSVLNNYRTCPTCGGGATTSTVQMACR